MKKTTRTQENFEIEHKGLALSNGYSKENLYLRVKANVCLVDKKEIKSLIELLQYYLDNEN